MKFFHSTILHHTTQKALFMPDAGNFLKNSHTWVLFALLLCIFGGAILGDSAAESLLLAHCDTRLLPSMFMANALLLFLTSAFLMSAIDRVDRGAFFLALVFGHWLVVTATRVALALGAGFLYPVIFSYAYVSKIVLFLMFWTMANDLTDSRKAAGVFPIIASGGTIGAIGASFAIPLFLKIISAENLLVVWSAAVLLLGILFMLFKGSFGKELLPSPERRRQAARGISALIRDVQLVKHEPLLKNMAVLYFLLFFILINQHYTFYSQLKIHLGSAKSLATFLGFFNGCSMFATLTLQTTVAGRILKKIGSTRSMLFLPSILCMVFICLSCLSLVPELTDEKAKSGIGGVIFWSVAIGMGLRAAFFDAFFSPNFQVFFSSLSKDIRGRGKLSIEGVVKPCAIIAASLWLLFAAPKIPLGWFMFLLFACSVLMIVQTLRIRKKYTESLTLSLTGKKMKQAIRLFDFVDLAKEENFLTALSRALEKEDYEIKHYVIGILADMNSRESIAILSEQLERRDDFTRSMIISALTPLKMENLKDTYSLCLKSPDRRVAANSILALAALQNGDVNEDLEAFLHHCDNRVRANAIIVLWPLWPHEKRKRLATLLAEMLFSENSFHAASALYAIETLRAGEFLPELRRFGAGALGRIGSDTMLWNRYLAAVASIGGEGALEMLLSLGRPGSEKKLKSLVAAVAGLLDGNYPLGLFFDTLSAADYRRRYTMLAALLSRRAQVQREHGLEARLKRLAHEEVKEIYRDWTSLSSLDAKGSVAGVRLLRTAVAEERIGDRLRNVVTISALLDASGQVGLVAHRLSHSNKHVRAQALEVFDNTGDAKINRWILRLLETNDPAAHARDAASGFQLSPLPLLETISSYADDPFDWIRQCAGYAAANLYYITRDHCWLEVTVRAEKGLVRE
jgi:hypothetical protein